MHSSFGEHFPRSLRGRPLSEAVSRRHCKLGLCHEFCRRGACIRARRLLFQLCPRAPSLLRLRCFPKVWSSPDVVSSSSRAQHWWGPVRVCTACRIEREASSSVSWTLSLQDHLFPHQCLFEPQDSFLWLRISNQLSSHQPTLIRVHVLSTSFIWLLVEVTLQHRLVAELI